MDSQPLDKISEAGAEAALYNLFATALSRKLDASWLTPSFRVQWESALPDISGKSEILGALNRAAQKETYYQEVLLDYDALFLVPGPQLIFPYESCYTHRNIDGSFGRLWQEPAQDMQRILQDWGIKFAEGWEFIPDHIGIELYFMSHLWHKASEPGLAKSERESLSEWQERFFATHITNWAFELLDNLERKADTDFYRGVAMVLRAFLKEEMSLAD
ncbi:MAG: molecular chaperone TorD family protein [Desulfitobacteriaceae bacterium]|nr:molecular chaperone TorD family protein [Desulfitobacteriaceae bacterium]MDI6880965.1 molecular chaperone TorD family protein [Desulfitobacteriaceae bacterium]MDI6913172.1 molecular chaperone TorD family protein [Desulfitobacteriaceae bacterium]